MVARAAAELERAGVIDRVRKDGTRSPWLWRFCELEGTHEATRWPPAETAVDRVLARSPLDDLGPVALDVYAHAALLADARGRISLPYRALKQAFGGRDPKTVLKHLRRLAEAGVGIASLEEVGAERAVVVELCVPAELTREEERSIVARISSAHERTKARRAKSATFERELEQVADVQDEETEAAWAKLPADRPGLRELVTTIVSRTEQEQRTLILGAQLEQGFIDPVLACCERHGDEFVLRVLRRLARRAGRAAVEGKRVMPACFARYLEAACAAEAEKQRSKCPPRPVHAKSSKLGKGTGRLDDAHWSAAMGAIVAARS